MNFLRKKSTENWIIKLFKTTDNKTAEQFDMNSCILSIIDLISVKTDLKPTDFDTNYKDSRKTFNGFKKLLKSQKEIVYCFVGFNSNKTNTYFTIINPMLNWTEQPKNSSIDILIQIKTEFITPKVIELISENLIKTFDFEYGYITKLPSNYDSGSERKIKKGFFAKRIDVKEIDLAWSLHSIGILEGFIKCLYPVNYLNKSHFSNLEIKKLILEYGIIENISDNITKWSLNSNEIDRLKNNLQINNISIITNNLEFLKTEKAKTFKDKMILKKSVM